MFIGAIIIFVSILIDIVTKQLAQSIIPDIVATTHSNIVLIPHLLELNYTENTGAGLSLFEGEQLLFMIITVIALIIFGYLFTQSDFKNKKVFSISIAFFIGGTLGNAIDRSLFGYVVDFMHFPFINPISYFYNNFADLFLSAAIVLFAIDLLFLESKRTKKENQNASINQDQS